MKLYDITQEVFSCEVFAGDPAPQRTVVCSMEEGSLYNLTAFSMCAHNGTHLDAPAHFLADGKTVEQIDLRRCVGPATVIEARGSLSAMDAERLLREARERDPDAARRILFKGDAVLSLEAAELLAREGILLVGVESQTVGPMDAPMAVHRALLGAETVILEGIRLSEVPSGVYFLFAAPLPLGGSDGAPCRALLVEGMHFISES